MLTWSEAHYNQDIIFRVSRRRGIKVQLGLVVQIHIFHNSKGDNYDITKERLQVLWK